MDVLTSFEEVLRGVVPLLLVVPGVILVAAGLFLWLGGLRLLRPLAAFCAAGAGLACALVFTERQLIPMILFTVIPAAIALFLEKPIVVVLGASLAGAVVLVFPLAVDGSLLQTVCEQAGPIPTTEEVSLFEAKAYGQVLADWAAGWGRAGWAALPDGRKAAAAGIGVGVLLAGCVSWRWVCALTCSTLGTGMIVFGLAVLVLSKGPQTTSYLADMRPYMWMVVGGMITAGTFLNRWLGPVKQKQEKIKEPHVQGDGK